MDTNALNSLRLSIFRNAEDLYREAKLLLGHGKNSRAYLLAHLCFEELGKIPMIVGAIGTTNSGGQVDWKKLWKRFRTHTSKIESQNQHYYMFGLDVDLLRNRDLEWLEKAQGMVKTSFERKNQATYVDVSAEQVSIPSEEISRTDAEQLVGLAFECLKAHWTSESLTNPILRFASDGKTPGND